MKRTGIFLWILALAWVGFSPLSAQNQGQAKANATVNSTVNYYRVDKVETIGGEIIRVESEKCYNQNDYTVIYLKEKKSGAIYRVEVSPQWFFEVDLMAGSRIEVTGSVNKSGNVNNIMTRSIMFRGQLFEFRDKHGFPLWRGKSGQGNRRGQGRGRRKHGQRGSY